MAELLKTSITAQFGLDRAELLQRNFIRDNPYYPRYPRSIF
jgi:hypothetical protein